MNLVFDIWDENNNPIPNFSHINHRHGREIVKFPYFLDESNIEGLVLNKVKPQEINENQPFYYIISHFDNYTFLLRNNDIIFSDEIEYHIVNTNLKVIFIGNHDSPEDFKDFFAILNKKINTNNWKANQFYIINNNSLIYELKTNINLYKIDYLFDLLSKTFKRYKEISVTEEDLITDKKFIFLFQNHLPHIHRVSMLTHLKNLNLLRDDITDWSLLLGAQEELKSIKKYKGYIDFDKKLIEDYKFICSSKKICHFEQNKEWFSNRGNHVNLHEIEIKSHQNSYINIVADTHFIQNDVHITEKSFKPFYYFQIPIFLTSYNHVKMIRKEYEFDLFDDLIDHSYDNEVDNIKRFHMVVDEIKRLSNMKEKIILYYKDNKKRLFENHNYIRKNPAEDRIKKYFLSL